MISQCAAAPGSRIESVPTIDGFAVAVDASGPDNGRAVVIFDDSTGTYDEIRERLHVAFLRTIVIPADPRLSPKSVVDILDRLGVPAAILIGDRAGAELAWTVAAADQNRFTGLVVIDCGHPSVPDIRGVVRDKDCPAVHVDTTVLVSSRAADAVARASRRHVHGEFRLTDLAGPRKSRHFTGQLVTEIVLRTHW